MILVVAFVTTALVCYAGVLLALRQHGWLLSVDIPNARSSHTSPTPRGGGVVIAITALMVVTGLAFYESALKSVHISYLVGGLMIAGLGFVDDRRGLNPRTRLVAQVCVSVSVAWVAVIGPAPLLGWHQVARLAVMTVVIVYYTNMYNFMDGGDGIAASQGVVAGLGWGGVGLLTGDPVIALIGCSVGGASAGFLGHNWAPARVFMGDVGSTYLGFTFGVLPFLADGGRARLTVVGCMFAWPCLVDTALTLLRRVKLGENLMVAHKHHIYQRLISGGVNHGRVAAAYAAMACAGVICGIMLVSEGWGAQP